jgi:hypothetical protein
LLSAPAFDCRIPRRSGPATLISLDRLAQCNTLAVKTTATVRSANRSYQAKLRYSTEWSGDGGMRVHAVICGVPRYRPRHRARSPEAHNAANFGKLCKILITYSVYVWLRVTT